ncbi:MAG: Rpn family recombination-promoting nuclease/putative transposase [Cyanobacteriota bacterium]|nr:Rpn family recombination-promoting nuclease/putative transposase [Cyanobacteriota bacterium]
MRTDTIFYQLFQILPEVLFELLGQPSELAQSYQFVSQEVKELAFRFDGIFLPRSLEQAIYFVEVQFQPKPEFYWDLFTEIFVYLGQYRPEQDWQVVAIFAERKLDPGVPKHYRGLELSGQLHIFYLEDLIEQETSSIGIGILQIVLAKESLAYEVAQRVLQRVRRQPSPDSNQLLELIEKVIVYKFSRLSRAELEAMFFTMDDLKQTRYVQDLIAEGEQRAEQRAEQRVEQIARNLLRMGMDSAQVADITGLSIQQVIALGDP